MTVHVWELFEVELKSAKQHADPYNNVDLWLKLKGPGFDKQVNGFWDGGNSYKVRFLATAAGELSWTSASNQDDPGLNGISGSFSAI